MTDHFEEIYATRAAEYHRMIAVEDVDGNLLPALERIVPLAGKKVLDLGSGSGRVPLLVAGRAAQVLALDLSRAMLREQKAQRDRVGGNWDLVQADMRWLPVPDRWAEVVIAGWAIGHLRGWFDADWKQQIGYVLEEMHRAVASGGAVIILETMTTGSLKPSPPTRELAEYYQWLEEDWGFRREVIQTDYQFSSVEEAIAYTEFFFGAELAAAIRQHGWARLPEWTGVWGKVV